MKRRAFITMLGGAVEWPFAARAQQHEQMRRVGVVMNLAADDPVSPVGITPLLQELDELRWTPGSTVKIEYRWGGEIADRNREYAAELVALAPDVIVAGGSSPGLAALRRATRTIPIVFASIVDPVGQGFVESLARPGGNATGFTFFEYGLSGKWLELLKEIVPGLTRVAVIRDATTAIGSGQLGAIQAVAPSLGVELRPVDVQDPGEIERAVAAFAGASRNGGLIVTAGTFGVAHRGAIIALAARYRFPAVYSFQLYVTAGGLISYGPDMVDPFRRAARHVDRILKGEK